jgi:hypothetical protein
VASLDRLGGSGAPGKLNLRRIPQRLPRNQQVARDSIVFLATRGRFAAQPFFPQRQQLSYFFIVAIFFFCQYFKKPLKRNKYLLNFLFRLLCIVVVDAGCKVSQCVAGVLISNYSCSACLGCQSVECSSYLNTRFGIWAMSNLEVDPRNSFRRVESECN